MATKKKSKDQNKRRGLWDLWPLCGLCRTALSVPLELCAGSGGGIVSIFYAVLNALQALTLRRTFLLSFCQ